LQKSRSGQAAPAMWGTPRTGMEQSPACYYDRGKGNLEEQVGAAEHGQYGQAAPANPNTGGNPRELWLTPKVGDNHATKHHPKRIDGGQPNLAWQMERQQLWPTPDATQANDGVPWEKFKQGMMERRERVKQAVLEGKTKQGSGRSPNLCAAVQNPQWATPKTWRTPSVAEAKNQQCSTQIYLQNQVGATEKTWATPQTRDNRSGGADRWENPERSRNLNDQIATVTKQNAKLNPRWVEALMGLPIGWTMQSCATPVTIGQMSSECSETELSPQPLPEPLPCLLPTSQQDVPVAPSVPSLREIAETLRKLADMIERIV